MVSLTAAVALSHQLKTLAARVLLGIRTIDMQKYHPIDQRTMYNAGAPVAFHRAANEKGVLFPAINLHRGSA